MQGPIAYGASIDFGWKSGPGSWDGMDGDPAGGIRGQNASDLLQLPLPQASTVGLDGGESGSAPRCLGIIADPLVTA